MAYKAFPKKCKELEEGWDEVSSLYKFLCWHCRKEVTASKRVLLVTLQNLINVILFVKF
jgi:hypothetical protein